MIDTLSPRFRAPRQVTVGEDRIPDYVSATRGSPHFYTPPDGFKLIVYHNGVRLSHIVEADRNRGWAVGLHYTEDKNGRVTFRPTDENGISQQRFYEGDITFRLEKIDFRIGTRRARRRA